MRLPIVGQSTTTEPPLMPRPGLRAALVYPPFGPVALPSLGLGLIGAGLKARGIACRTFHWNLELAAGLDGSNDLRTKLDLYSALTNRHWMPFNEWAFNAIVFPYEPAELDSTVRAQLDTMVAQAYPDLELRRRLTQAITSLRARASEHVDTMARRLAEFDIVGINSTFFQNMPALALARRVKELWPDKLIVMGGANCDGEMGPALAEKFAFVDAIFIGEVDHAFPEFVARWSLGMPTDSVPGSVTRKADGTLCFGPPAVPLEQLDSLPIPDFDDFVAERRALAIDTVLDLTLPLESSRGCWWGARHHCTFCGLNANGMGYRRKTDTRFQAEVEQIVARYDVRHIFMADNILSMDYFGRFMDWAAALEPPVQFFYEIKANANRRHVERLASARISAVQPGIESFSSSVLALMRKGTTGIQNVAFLKYAREYGIYTAYNILVGFPGEEPAEYPRLAKELPKLFHLRPPSGVPEIEYHRFSPYHQDPKSFGIELRASRKYDYLYPFPPDEISRIAYMFERRDDQPRERRYLAQFYEQVMQWRDAYSEHDCTLMWHEDGLDVLVVDRRPGFGARTYRLKRYAVDVFRATDYPTAIRHIVEAAVEAQTEDDSTALLSSLFGRPAGDNEVVIDFGARELVADPGTCLEPLVGAGLLYVEKEKYLALPVRSSFSVVDSGWARTGI